MVFHHVLLAADLEFSKATATGLIGCDAQDRISTFRLMPHGELTATGTLPSTAAPETGVTRALNVRSPFAPLPGTLLLPRFRAFRDMAKRLAASGVGSFRYDKRTQVYSKGTVTASLAVDDEATDDALAALQLLARQPELNHLFMRARHPPSATDYAKPGPVQTWVLQDIVSWIKAVLP